MVLLGHPYKSNHQKNNRVNSVLKGAENTLQKLVRAMPTEAPPKYKKLQRVIDAQNYRTDTSTLLAYDRGAGIFLFRALNSNYFVQDDANESIEVLELDEAERMYDSMPSKHVTSVVAAFPKCHGGVGLDTDINLYDR